jgi:hypothetical protein
MSPPLFLMISMALCRADFMVVMVQKHRQFVNIADAIVPSQNKKPS